MLQICVFVLCPFSEIFLFSGNYQSSYGPKWKSPITRYSGRLLVRGQALNGWGLLQEKPQMSKKEIEDLLKKGAYGAIMDDDTAGDDFCEEDIDQILKRRTQIIQIEAEEKGSTFAKVTQHTWQGLTTLLEFWKWNQGCRTWWLFAVFLMTGSNAVPYI